MPEYFPNTPVQYLYSFRYYIFCKVCNSVKLSMIKNSLSSLINYWFLCLALYVFIDAIQNQNKEIGARNKANFYQLNLFLVLILCKQEAIMNHSISGVRNGDILDLLGTLYWYVNSTLSGLSKEWSSISNRSRCTYFGVLQL